MHSTMRMKWICVCQEEWICACVSAIVHIPIECREWRWPIHHRTSSNKQTKTVRSITRENNRKKHSKWKHSLEVYLQFEIWYLFRLCACVFVFICWCCYCYWVFWYRLKWNFLIFIYLFTSFFLQQITTIAINLNELKCHHYNWRTKNYN